MILLRLLAESLRTYTGAVYLLGFQRDVSFRTRRYVTCISVLFLLLHLLQNAWCLFVPSQHNLDNFEPISQTLTGLDLLTG